MEEIRCSVCGSLVNAGDSFCQNCGSPVNADAPAKETVTGAQAETPTEPVQQETTVLSGNPYTMNNGEQTSSQDTVSNTNMNTTDSSAYTGAGTATSAVYQQPISGQGTNYQGSYNAAYTQSTAAPVTSGPSKGLGVAGLVLGIIGIITGCCYGGFVFGLIGLILSIVYVAKKGSKGLGISGIITSALGLILSIVMLILLLAAPSILYEAMPDEYKYLIEDEIGGSSTDDFGFPTEDTEEPEDIFTAEPGTTSSITSMNQIIVNDTVYTLPETVSSLGFTVDTEYHAEDVAAVSTDGVLAGDYIFVLLHAGDGTSFWGYIENTGTDTIYSLEELTVTGINVDNYSSDCTAYYVESYGGIQLGMTRSDVETLLGFPDSYDNGMDVYESDTGYEAIRLEYDDDDNVIAIDLTIY